MAIEDGKEPPEDTESSEEEKPKVPQEVLESLERLKKAEEKAKAEKENKEPDEKSTDKKEETAKEATDKKEEPLKESHDDNQIETKPEAVSETKEQEKEPEPMIQETETTLVSTEQTVEEKKEAEFLDQMFSVQSWAMQSQQWRMLNVFFDLFTPEQLQKKINESSIVYDFCDLLELALWRPYDGPLYLRSEKELKSAMTQVRTYILNTFLPQLVNKTQPEMTAELSLKYMNLVNKGLDVESHMRDYKVVKADHFSKIQDIHE